jgi:hypothetical protein
LKSLQPFLMVPGQTAEDLVFIPSQNAPIHVDDLAGDVGGFPGSDGVDPDAPGSLFLGENLGEGFQSCAFRTFSGKSAISGQQKFRLPAADGYSYLHTHTDPLHSNLQVDVRIFPPGTNLGFVLQDIQTPVNDLPGFPRHNNVVDVIPCRPLVGVFIETTV